MNGFLDRLARVVRARRRIIIAIWIGVVLVSLPLASREGKALTNGGYIAPGSESRTVELALKRFPALSRDDLAVVLRSDRPQRRAVAREVERVRRAVDATSGVRLDRAAALQAVRQAATHDTVIVPIAVTGTYDDANNAAVDLSDALDPGSRTQEGLSVYFIGQSALWAALSKQAQKDLTKAEAVGLPIVFLILVAVFGSLAAAVLPLLLGGLAVILTAAAVYLLSLVGDVSVYVTNSVSMIGIGVAVDYSLFILVRYRQHLIDGASRESALRSAVRTSGFAVLVSALTVIVSLAGLLVVDSTVLRSLALGAMIVVGIALLGALTLTPILTEKLGHRGRRISRTVQQSPSTPVESRGAGVVASSFWRRWTARVMGRPVLAAALSAGLLLLLAAPTLDLRTGESALAELPADHEVRTGLALASAIAGPGATGPIRLLADFRTGRANDRANAADLQSFLSRVRADPRVALVQPPVVSTDGRAVLVSILPRAQPDSAEADALVANLSERARAALGVRADTAIGGTTAQTRDFQRLISGSLWKVLIFIVVCTFVLLAVLLRSLVLPLKAVIVTTLTVAAAYGILVAIFQWEIFGDSVGYISVMDLPLILAVTFGLTMDYQVFLLLRIRERYAETHDNERAVAEGLASSAGVITSAAAIMVAVFGTFAATGVPTIRQLGIGLAVAIALDATLVRLVLVPAMMKLLGEWNWWFPRRLGSRIPEMPSEFSVERPAPVVAPARKL